MCIYSFGYSERIISRVCFKGGCVEAEVADSRDKRMQGLMFRESLPKNSGMLFIFDKEEDQGFWMKNMNFALDVIWINADKEVVKISKNVPPCKDECESISPGKKVKYVLEVNSGFAESSNIRAGETVEIR